MTDVTQCSMRSGWRSRCPNETSKNTGDKEFKAYALKYNRNIEGVGYWYLWKPSGETICKACFRFLSHFRSSGSGRRGKKKHRLIPLGSQWKEVTRCSKYAFNKNPFDRFEPWPADYLGINTKYGDKNDGKRVILQCEHKEMDFSCICCVILEATTKYRKKMKDLSDKRGRTWKKRIAEMSALLSNLLGSELVHKNNNSIYVGSNEDSGDNMNKIVPIKKCGEFLVARAIVTKRGYNCMRESLKECGVLMCSYSDTRRYLDESFNIKPEPCELAKENRLLKSNHGGNHKICGKISIKDWLDEIFINRQVLEHWSWLDDLNMLVHLKQTGSKLYQNLILEPKRTIHLILGLDGTISTAENSLERASFSLLNFLDHMNNTFFNFLICLYHGKETLEDLRAHLGDTRGFPFCGTSTCENKDIFSEATALTLYGYTPPGNRNCNVLVYLSTDLKAMEAVFARASSISSAGDPLCTNPIEYEEKTGENNKKRKTMVSRIDTAIASNFLQPVELRTMQSMVEQGVKSEALQSKYEEEKLKKMRSKKKEYDEMAKNVGGSTIPFKEPVFAKYDDRWKSCEGQKFVPLYTGVDNLCKLVDGLHLNLGLYKVVFQGLLALSGRNNMDYILPQAFAAAGLDSIAIQIQRRLNSKPGTKLCNDSDVMQSISINGNNGRKMESRIMFVMHHLYNTVDDVDKSINAPNSSVMAAGLSRRDECFNFVIVCILLQKITRLVRQVTMNVEEAAEFEQLCHRFLRRLKDVIPDSKFKKSVYIHFLSHEMIYYVKMFAKLMGLGPGAWWTSVGEHKNKFVKVMEAQHSNFSDNRYENMIKNEFIRFFLYPQSCIQKIRQNLTCGGCGDVGHMRTNRSCRNNPKTCVISYKSFFSPTKLQSATDSDIQLLKEYCTSSADDPEDEENDDNQALIDTILEEMNDTVTEENA